MLYTVFDVNLSIHLSILSVFQSSYHSRPAASLAHSKYYPYLTCSDGVGIFVMHV